MTVFTLHFSPSYFCLLHPRKVCLNEGCLVDWRVPISPVGCQPATGVALSCQDRGQGHTEKDPPQVQMGAPCTAGLNACWSAFSQFFKIQKKSAHISLSLDYNNFSVDPSNYNKITDLSGEGEGEGDGDGVLLLAPGLTLVLFAGEMLFLLLGGAVFFLLVSGGLADLI